MSLNYSDCHIKERREKRPCSRHGPGHIPDDRLPVTIDTIQRGIFLGQHRPRYHLPPAFTSLYNNHQHSSSPLFSIFYKFAPDLASLCTSNNTTENQISTFISHSPLHQCHDAINTNIKHRLQSDFLQRLDKDSNTTSRKF